MITYFYVFGIDYEPTASFTYTYLYAENDFPHDRDHFLHHYYFHASINSEGIIR